MALLDAQRMPRFYQPRYSVNRSRRVTSADLSFGSESSCPPFLARSTSWPSSPSLSRSTQFCASICGVGVWAGAFWGPGWSIVTSWLSWLYWSLSPVSRLPVWISSCSRFFCTCMSRENKCTVCPLWKIEAVRGCRCSVFWRQTGARWDSCWGYCHQLYSVKERRSLQERPKSRRYRPAYPDLSRSFSQPPRCLNSSRLRCSRIHRHRSCRCELAHLACGRCCHSPFRWSHPDWCTHPAAWDASLGSRKVSSVSRLAGLVSRRSNSPVWWSPRLRRSLRSGFDCKAGPGTFLWRICLPRPALCSSCDLCTW